MTSKIKCPSCQHEFEPTDAMRDELQKQLNEEAARWKKEKEDEWRKQLHAKDMEAQKMLEEERKKIIEQMEQNLRRQLASDYELKLKMMEQNLAENEEKLKLSRERELEFLKKQKELLDKEKELDLELEKRMLNERNSLAEKIRKEEQEKNSLKETEWQMRMKEMEKQLEDQRKLAEEMKRKAEQGSMQLQGEVQELALEALLRNAFPFDVIGEVGKGVREADCIHTVRNNFGQECGKIIYESKRTQSFSVDWIEKLKSDARNLNAEVAVIVTQTMPKDMDCFGEKDGVWICSFEEVKALAAVLRDLIIKVFIAAKNEENKGDKMHMLYSYLTSREFSEQWKAIREGFMSMKLSIQRERDAMEKLWKAREKQLEKVLLNAAHIKGSIDGISGMDTVDLTLGTDENLLIEN